MQRSGWTLSLVLGGALAALTPARAATANAAPQPSGFAPTLEFIGIRDIQKQLAARGYDPGPATGTMSEATQRAIVAYQHDYGLAPDGIAGPMVQNALHFMPRRPPPAALAALTPPPLAPSAVPPALAPPVAAPRIAVPPPLAMPVPPAPPPPPAASLDPNTPPDTAAADAVPPDGPAPPIASSDTAEPPPVTADQAEAGPAPAVAKEAALDTAPPPHGPALGPLDPKPIAAPRTPVGVGPIAAGAAQAGADPATIAPVAAAVAAAPVVQDAALATGDEAVRQAQGYLKELGFFAGEPDGVMDWSTADALVKFDASGAGPNQVIADARHPDAMWLARLRTAAAAKEAAVKAP